MSARLIAAALAIATLAAPAARAQDCDTARGERVFANCAICHSRQAKAPSPAGPNLHGVVGRKAGTLAGFKYSRALREFAKPWTAEALDRFLASPQSAVPGTAMPFAGLRNADDRAAVICLLAKPN